MSAWLRISLILIWGASAAHARELAAPAFDQNFWPHWGDGQAELAAYDLQFDRYGQARSGLAVTIFVTETFSNELRVKADPGRHPKEDTFGVMKLNLVTDFPTGVYDYNMMTSSFVALQPVNDRPAGPPTKVSFSAQEWCGHVYQQTLFHNDHVDLQSHSYFDGEADQALELTADGLASEDGLWHWARGLAWPQLDSGETAEIQLLRSATTARLRHVPVVWETAELSVAATSESVSVPAGDFDVVRRRVHIEGDLARDWTFWVEAAWPHRIVQWENSLGQRAVLVGEERLKYWQLNGNGLEERLVEFGLSPRSMRTP